MTVINSRQASCTQAFGTGWGGGGGGGDQFILYVLSRDGHMFGT